MRRREPKHGCCTQPSELAVVPSLSVAVERLLARAGCTPGRSRHNAATSQGTGRHPAGGVVITRAAHNAPRAKSTALTPNPGANPVALPVLTLTRPMDPIDISAPSRETALLIAV